MRYQLTPTRIYYQETDKTDEKLPQLSYNAGWCPIQHGQFGKQSGSFLKGKIYSYHRT
jgi:hypothetical protein